MLGSGLVGKLYVKLERPVGKNQVVWVLEEAERLVVDQVRVLRLSSGSGCIAWDRSGVCVGGGLKGKYSCS